MGKYDGLGLFFEKEINEICEKSKEEWIQTGIQIGIQIGIQTGIYNTIYRNLRVKYNNKPVSKRLKEKIDSINYYPALEEVQDAILLAPSLAAFGRKVNEIVKKYEVEIQETRK